MNPLDRLSEYLRTVEKRLRFLTWTRGAAIAAIAIATVAIHPITVSSGEMQKSPMTRRFLAIVINNAMTGTASAPLMTATQTKAVIGLSASMLLTAPSSVAGH